MESFVHYKTIRENGTADSFRTISAPVKFAPLEWQKRGLSFTASGYGARIPTTYVIKVDGRWRRVYCRIYSNSGTLFIGKKYTGEIVVTIAE